MRNLTKRPKPVVLAENEVNWLSDYLSDLSNTTNKYRYRHRDIKSELKIETSDKCVYCESKIGYNTPGDVEHKVPSSVNRNLHFTWNNLTIACTECNRRKNNYFDDTCMFLDPYVDNVESCLEHHGPVVTSRIGNNKAEVTVAILQFCSEDRIALVKRKIAKMQELQHVLERYNSTDQGALREVLLRQLRDMASIRCEYSAMVRSALQLKGYSEVIES
jgi:uncharacterized protein (TIGR02646 family)